MKKKRRRYRRAYRDGLFRALEILKNSDDRVGFRGRKETVAIRRARTEIEAHLAHPRPWRLEAPEKEPGVTVSGAWLQ